MGPALRAIQDRLPPVIAIERTFAGSLPGQGLIKRIKGDVKLRQCAIEMVGIRRAERFRVGSVEIHIDDNPAQLLDISTAGALVVSAWSLKPRQRVRVMLRSGERAVTALVVWAHFELPNEGPRYRAGIEFVASATEPVAEFMTTVVTAGP